MIKAVERNARDARTGSPREADAMAHEMLTAARRQNALDRVAELLDEWGSANPQTRAVAILEAVTEAGYRLPELDPPAPYRGRGSTEEGRTAARALFVEALEARRSR